MASVCLTCGDRGKAELLIYCRKCRDSAVHHYCMDDVSPNDDNINWRCWDCAPKGIKDKPLRKSERICPKRQKVLKTRNFCKGWLNQNRKLVQISNEVDKIGLMAIDRHSQSLYERRKDLDILEEKKSVSEIPSHYNESVKINEPSTLPIQNQEENSMQSMDETQKVHHVPSLVANEHCISPQKLCDQPSLEPDDGIVAAPVIDPKWRGWFNINEVDDETCEILAHLSNKACLKVSDAATEMLHTLDIQILDKHVVWPQRFIVSPPTTANIALYFFPARDKDERVYDVLLDEVIEGELALKAMVNNVELLIFSSYELPLEHRRFNGKYFFWGVFRQKQQSHSLSETVTTASREKGSVNSGHCEPNDLLHYKSADGLKSPSLHYLSPLSTNSSQASNVLPSKHNTLDSLVYPPYKLNNASYGDSILEEGKVGCLVDGGSHYKSRQFYLRPSPTTAAKVI